LWELHPENLQAWQEFKEQLDDGNYRPEDKERQDKEKESQATREQVVRNWQTILKDAGLVEATVFPAWQAFELASSLL
jgi:hypothetical protein